MLQRRIINYGAFATNDHGEGNVVLIRSLLEQQPAAREEKSGGSSGTRLWGRGECQAARAAGGVRASRPVGRCRPHGGEPRARGPRRSRDREVSAARLCGELGRRRAHAPGDWRRIRDGAAVRHAAPAVRAAARPAEGSSAATPRRARDGVRDDARNPARPFPRRPGGARPAVGCVGGVPPALRDRRRAVDGPGVGAGAWLRGPAAAGGVGRPRLRHPPAEPRTARTAGARGHRASRPRRACPAELRHACPA